MDLGGRDGLSEFRKSGDDSRTPFAAAIRIVASGRGHRTHRPLDVRRDDRRPRAGCDEAGFAGGANLMVDSCPLGVFVISGSLCRWPRTAGRRGGCPVPGWRANGSPRAVSQGLPRPRDFSIPARVFRWSWCSGDRVPVRLLVAPPGTAHRRSSCRFPSRERSRTDGDGHRVRRQARPRGASEDPPASATLPAPTGEDQHGLRFRERGQVTMSHPPGEVGLAKPT